MSMEEKRAMVAKMEKDAELWYVKEIRPLAEGDSPCIISYEEVVERAVKHFGFDDFDMPMTAMARGNGPKYQALYDTLKTLCDRDEARRDDRKVESEPEVKVENELEVETADDCIEVYVEKWEDYDDLDNDAWEEVDEFKREFPLDDLEGAKRYFEEVLLQKRHYRDWKHITLCIHNESTGEASVLREESWERGET